MSQPSNSPSQPSMLSTMTMIHMGAEILIIAGLVYWIHSKNRDTQDTIAALEARVSACEATIESQARIIENMNNFLQAFSQQQQQQMGLTQPQNRPTRPQRTQKPQKPQKLQKPRTNISQTIESQEEYYENEEELDSLLEDEIEDLNCVDGQCELPGKKKQPR